MMVICNTHEHNTMPCHNTIGKYPSSYIKTKMQSVSLSSHKHFVYYPRCSDMPIKQCKIRRHTATSNGSPHGREIQKKNTHIKGVAPLSAPLPNGTTLSVYQFDAKPVKSV